MDGQVVRDLVPAVTPLLAVVTAADWGTGLARASRFASYCRRMVLSSAVPISGQIPETAGRLGIGLAVQDGSGPPEILLEPEPVLDWQPTTAWWRFCEVIWDEAGRG
jgi:hypothetical protein